MGYLGGITYRKEHKRGALDELLENYFAGLSDVCHNLFGKEGENALYVAIGKKFVERLEKKGEVVFSGNDPWVLCCDTFKLFTRVGFYDYVELQDLGDGQYWMLEVGQYAGEVWEEQGSWQRGTPPCPLWASIVYILGRAGFKIVLDKLRFDEKACGFESKFHFEQIAPFAGDLTVVAKDVIAAELLPICMHCKKIRDSDGKWHPVESYLLEMRSIQCSHGICEDCLNKYYPNEVAFQSKRC